MPRAQQMHMVPLQTMMNEAIGFIRQHVPPEGYFVAFSGGKDSIVTLELTRMAGVKHQAYYSATGIDPPEVVQFIRKHYPDVTFFRPKMTFWEGIRRKDPPSRWQRWCCDVLKKDPSKSIPLTHRLSGIRAEESIGRKGRPRVDYFKAYKQHIYKPIFDWRSWHIWDFIDQYSLPYPSLYDEGWDRIGCVVCPFHCHKNMRMIRRNMERWPKMFKVFEKVVAEWFEEKRKGHDKDFDTAEQYIEAWYRGFE